ncbi:histone deacetylase family protein [Hyphobacterium marinum]|uniref:Histone deacetylase family protein n=1 Tax=Hyphobacterium marinum TaxID=3116574 RepID=A0ABU7M0R9_9PROT|nr:histone deacetylase family protein [Hyphobacterium sp. Y6023]MEE2567398.1 histone deacetylase family protein [Hyphobacterium sp. Y6023]
MNTGVITAKAGFEHRIPPAHAEQPARLQSVLDALNAPDLAALPRIDAPRADRAALERVHTEAHVDRIFASEPDDDTLVGLDWDTFMTKGSLEAALRAAGAGMAAVDSVLSGEFDAAFCAIRPPGHHAERARPMGFCLFNNIAIAAMHALETHGLSRVAIVDIDVHHGNGSQELAEREPRVFFASIHESPLYPGTGMAGETGLDGNVVNVPVGAGLSGPGWRAAIEREITPALRAFAPDLILVSAGFDAHADDPLAGLQLQEADFAWAAAHLAALAGEIGHKRLVCLMEGGYDLPALGRSAAAFVQSLAEA